MLHVTKKTISRTLLRNTIFTISLTVFAIGLFWVWSEFSASQKLLAAKRAELIETKRSELQDHVNRVISHITYEKSQLQDIGQKVIRDQVYSAHAVATHLYETFKDTHTPYKLQSLVRESLRPIRFNDGKGYFFATDFNGIEQLFADRPELEGKNLYQMQDFKGAYVIQDMIKIVKEQDEGFYSYSWTMPGVQGSDHLKISFVKHFEPFNWFIGTGLYLEDLESEVKEEAILHIEAIKFGRDGYVFAAQWDGLALTYPAKDKNMLSLTDSNGVKIVQELITLAKNGGGFLEYVMPELANERPLPKISYVKGIPEWQWLIGAGVYIDDIEETIALAQKQMLDKIIQSLFQILLVLTSVMFVALWATTKTTKQIQSGIDSFLTFFNQAATESIEMDPNKVKFNEFKNMANATNSMLEKRKEAETKLLKIEESLRQSQKMKSIGLMAGGVAHDLNNILSGIVGYPELLLNNLPKNSELRKPIIAIQESGQRASMVVADLLTVARGAATTRELCDLNTLIIEYLKSPECLSLKSLHPDITYQFHRKAEDAPILCSPVHVKKSIMNLVLNANEAIGDSGKVILSTEKLHIDSTQSTEFGVAEGPYIVLTITDTGPGISETDREHIFEPFYTKKTMGRSGTGLGLTVVWNTMEDHLGKVTVERKEGRTSFQLYFPFNEEAEVAQHEVRHSEKITGNGERILVIDDEPNLRDLGCQMLQNLGYTVESVTSGEQAVAFVKKQKVDLLLIDMLMGRGMNGRQTYEEIIKIHPGQKAIIVSGFAVNDEVEAALELGVSLYIKKPFSMNQLGLAVKDALKKA